MIKRHSSEELGTFEYDDTEFEIIKIEGTIALEYIGSGKDVRLPVGCINCLYMFDYYRGSLDLSNFDTSEVTGMNHMFYGCKIPKLDLSNFNTEKVITFSSMFKFSTIDYLDVSSFDTRSAYDMHSMFHDCKCRSLDISNFNTESVRYMSEMFRGYRYSVDLSNFDTKNVQYMKGMFKEYSAFNLDISNFNTGNIKNMSDMFNDCSCSNLKLPSINFRRGENIESIFSWCSAIIQENRNSDTLIGIQKTEEKIDSIKKRCKLLGKELPTLYRSCIVQDIEYISLNYRGEQIGYRVRYKTSMYDIGIEEGYLFKCTSVLNMRLIDGLLKSGAEIYHGLVVHQLLDYPDIMKELNLC